MAEITIATDETAVGSDPGDELSRLSQNIVQDMLEYARQHNVDVTGTRAGSDPDRQPIPKITFTVPKFISQEHRDQLERIAYTRAAQHAGQVEIQFIYEQSAG